jgi:hypothetical protein
MANQISEASLPTPSPGSPPNSFASEHAVFLRFVLLLIALAILRSAIATRLDSFTVDEAYHIAAGVSYVRYHDFRINPEHPPFVKLWVGSFIAATGFHLDPLRQFDDKFGERLFTERAVFRQNDPDSVQRRARAAMYTLNGLLLFALALALERTFNSAVSLGTLLFLAIDPTVAAHLPVVMTDLPVALLSTTAVVLAARAFRTWLWTDLAACSFFLGLALTAKHSAPVVFLSVALIAILLAIFQPISPSGDSRWRKALKLGAVLAGAMTVLWASYLFRYSESPSHVESFNRPLAAKINDVISSRYRAVLSAMSLTRVVPRAYLWGFADTIRAGMEGRENPQLFFGRVYQFRAPKYFFPATIAIKLPIGLLVLLVLGLFFFLARRIPPHLLLPCTVVLAVATLFLIVLSAGATYAGVRHALPVVVLLSVFSGISFAIALSSKTSRLKILVALAFIAAAVSALPHMRPWEYFNEFVGGTSGAYKYFCDEGVDLGQRTKEVTNFYHRELQPTGLRPDCLFSAVSEEELYARNINCFGTDKVHDPPLEALPQRSGTIFVAPFYLIPAPYWDRPALRAATPIARFGNLFVLRGDFSMPGQAASYLYWLGIEKLFGEKTDVAEAEKAFRRSIELDPTAYFVYIDLGNLSLKRGSREDCVRYYSQALQYAPDEPALRSAILKQIQLVSRDPLAGVSPLRDPNME